MLVLDTKAFEEIRVWMHRNARQLELSIWRHEFENGSKEDIVTAIGFYQNPDGGFGNALEPDCWNPESSPYTTLNAASVLKEIGFDDVRQPIMRGILNFFESGAYSCENGWMFNIPSNDNYPHAPWWSYDTAANEYESVGLSAEIAGFVLRYADKDSALFKRAVSIAHRLTDKLNTTDNYGEMGVRGYCALTDGLRKSGLTDEFNIEFLSKTVKTLVDAAIERDVSKWTYYGKRPSSFITSPESEFYTGNEDITNKELDYLIETRQHNGVWGITWSWFENNEKYAKEFAISENWWKATLATDKVKLLRNFGRIAM